MRETGVPVITPFAPNDNPAGRLPDVTAQVTDAESYAASQATEYNGLKSYPDPPLYATVSFPFGNVAEAKLAVTIDSEDNVWPSVSAHVPESAGSSISHVTDPDDVA